MADVYDVAKYILTRHVEGKKGEMTAMKLQKLVYYAQAWQLAWTEKPLFENKIEAWINGPVCRDLYDVVGKVFRVKTFSKGDISNLTDDEKETIDIVLKTYGDKGPQWLSDLTHMEDPWKLARAGKPRDVVGYDEITQQSMLEYYSNL